MSVGRKTKLEPVTTKISLRPVRIGFLVNPNDRVMLSKVVRVATCMWGGLMCPIIPVTKRLPRVWQHKPFKRSALQIMRGYLTFFEPDVLVQTAPGQFDLLGIGEDGAFDRRRYASLNDVIQKDHGLEDDLDVGLNMYYRYLHLFKDEFQFAKRLKPRILSFKEGTRAQAAFFEAAFGCFPKGDTLHYLSKAYHDALEAEEASPTPETWAEIIKGHAGYPLYYTVRDTELLVGERSSPSVFIFDPLNPADVIDFWNFRLFTRDVLPVNSHWLGQSRDLIGEFIRGQYRLLPTNPNGVMIRTALHVARSLEVEAVHAALKLHEFELPAGSYTIQGWYSDIWREHDDQENVSRPTASVLSVKERDVQIVPTGSRAHITLQYPALSPDFDAGRMGNGPKWVNTIQVGQYAANPEVALALPSAGFNARPHYPTAGGDQFVSREGYVTFHRYRHDNSYLTLPSPMQAITSWLNADEISVEASDAGRVAEQVIAAVGGLRGSHVFRDRDIVSLLDKMARSRKEWADGSSEEFEGRAAPVQTWLKTLNPIQKKRFGRWWTLESFVEHNILQICLSVRCPLCTQKNSYSLDEVASEVRCSRCTKTFPYPQGQTESTPWEYRVVGPFATPHYARGAYTVALTLRFLDDIMSMNNFTYSTGIELEHKGKKVETDFFAWQNRNGYGRAPKNPVTLLGECKSFGTDAFKADDIDKLKRLAELVPGAYLVASTMKAEFSAEEIKRLRALAKWGWSLPRPSALILLTGTELFGDTPLSRSWNEAGGRAAEVGKRYAHVFDFPTLAAATQELHLNLEPKAISDMRYGRRQPARISARLSLTASAAQRRG